MGDLTCYLCTFVDTLIEPYDILQIAVSLFSAIADAHALNIGLVDISMDNLWLNLDGNVYFDGFKSCLGLLDNNKDCLWIDFDCLQCPGKFWLQNT